MWSYSRCHSYPFCRSWREDSGSQTWGWVAEHWSSVLALKRLEAERSIFELQTDSISLTIEPELGLKSVCVYVTKTSFYFSNKQTISFQSQSFYLKHDEITHFAISLVLCSSANLLFVLVVFTTAAIIWTEGIIYSFKEYSGVELCFFLQVIRTLYDSYVFWSPLVITL